MEFPVTINIANASVHLHWILETAAYFIGFRYFLILRKKQGDVFTTSSRIWIIIGAIFGALAGSHIVGSLERPYEIFITDNIFWYIYNNKTVVGGFLGGLAGVELMKKTLGEKRASGDLFVYPMILALTIGRIGCFSMGVYEETYGIESSVPWAMNLGDGMLRHPVALYEILFLLFLWGMLHTLKMKMAFQSGGFFKLFMISYLLFRFLIEFIKPHYSFSFGLSTIQIACVAGLTYYARYIIQPKKLILSYA